jgi:hypothetical protein
MNLLGNFTSLPSNLSITLPLIYCSDFARYIYDFLTIPSNLACMESFGVLRWFLACRTARIAQTEDSLLRLFGQD